MKCAHAIHHNSTGNHPQIWHKLRTPGAYFKPFSLPKSAIWDRTLRLGFQNMYQKRDLQTHSGWSQHRTIQTWTHFLTICVVPQLFERWRIRRSWRPPLQETRNLRTWWKHPTQSPSKNQGPWKAMKRQGWKSADFVGQSVGEATYSHPHDGWTQYHIITLVHCMLQAAVTWTQVLSPLGRTTISTRKVQWQRGIPMSTGYTIHWILIAACLCDELQ